MARHPEDQKTGDLLTAEIAPVPVKRGRPYKGNRPMTAAERKRASRAKLVARARNSVSVQLKLERDELLLLKRLLTRQEGSTPSSKGLLKKVLQAEQGWLSMTSRADEAGDGS